MLNHLHFIESTAAWQQLLPLSYTRPIADLRVGILTIAEKWMKRLNGGSVSYASASYLSALFPEEEKPNSIFINSQVLPTNDLAARILELNEGESIIKDGMLIATRNPESKSQVEFSGFLNTINYPWDIFRLNRSEIISDFELLTDGRTSQDISDPYTRVYGDNLFIEQGAKIRAAIIDTEAGPVYLGKNSIVNEGAIIKGAFALGAHAHVNMGAKIKGDSTIGPECKVGGEVSNSVFHGYSNKGHDGFIGNSVIGQWCNLGADTNNSNLKNNYTNVKMWDFQSGRFKDTGLQFCGLIMGDHSKCGINTMFNTGTTVGVSANIFGAGFPRTIIPSFAWGGSAGYTTFKLPKVFETAELVMQRRKKPLNEDDRAVLKHIYEITAVQRNWEK